jgi:hypothetical protein
MTFLVGLVLILWLWASRPSDDFLTSKAEPSLAWHWRPACSYNWLPMRIAQCEGQTSGPVPAIDGGVFRR